MALYVINLEDGGGKEFFFTVKGQLIALGDMNEEFPQTFKTAKLMIKRMDQLRPRYPCTCRLYGLHIQEFEARRKIVQEESAIRKSIPSADRQID
ncbi:hypothetical protein [Spirosoma aerophilum]